MPFTTCTILPVGLCVTTLLLMSGCTSGETNRPDPEPTTATAEHDAPHETVHWGYEGEEGPEHWGALSPEYASCSTGTEQSPIDIAETEAADLAGLVFNYRPAALVMINNGHTIQVNNDEGSSMNVDGVPYRLLQFHFHHPSEHTLEGTSFDMEMHLVHQNAEGELAVVGVLIAKGTENPAVVPVWDHLPAETGSPETISGVSVNVEDVLPEARDYYRYAGSLTTPPCTEGVTWLVLRTPIEFSEAQIAAFGAIMPPNNRPVQPLSERKVLRDTSAN